MSWTPGAIWIPNPLPAPKPTPLAGIRGAVDRTLWGVLIAEILAVGHGALRLSNKSDVQEKLDELTDKPTDAINSLGASRNSGTITDAQYRSAASNLGNMV